jgi:hypothetical protein
MGTPVSHGFESQLGIGTEVTLGTEVVVTEKIPYRSESIKAQNNHVLDNSLCGPATRPVSQQGTLIVEGGFEAHMRYTLAQLIFQHFFGTFLTDTPVVGTNTYSLDPSIDGDGVTLAIEKTVSVWTTLGYKASELEITGSPADGIIYSVDGFGTDQIRNSIINTSAVLDALAIPGDFMLFQDMRLRIGDHVDALSAADDLDISEFTLNINRQLEPTEVNSFNRLEAVENNFRETTLSITIPRYCADTFIDFHRNHTQLQAELFFSDGTNSKTILIPNMLTMEFDAEIGGPEFTPLTVTFTAHPNNATPAANTFMTLNDVNAEVEMQEN